MPFTCVCIYFCPYHIFFGIIAYYLYSVAYLGFYFGGGGSKFFWKVGVFAWREAPCSAWLSHAFPRGVWGHVPPINFLKMVQFGAF